MSDRVKRWKVEIFVAENWVDDGFELTEDVLKDAIMSHCLGYATESEVQVRMLNHGEMVRARAIPDQCGCEQCRPIPKTLCEVFAKEAAMKK